MLSQVLLTWLSTLRCSILQYSSEFYKRTPSSLWLSGWPNPELSTWLVTLTLKTWPRLELELWRQQYNDDNIMMAPPYYIASLHPPPPWLRTGTEDDVLCVSRRSSDGKKEAVKLSASEKYGLLPPSCVRSSASTVGKSLLFWRISGTVPFFRWQRRQRASPPFARQRNEESHHNNRRTAGCSSISQAGSADVVRHRESSRVF